MGKSGKRAYILGIDEVGRGALAGPVVVAGLILPKNLKIRTKKSGKPLKDSKKLTQTGREFWFDYAKRHPKIFYEIARVSPRVIDRVNISRAANLAAYRAFQRLKAAHGTRHVIFRTYLDGGLFLFNRLKSEALGATTLIKGDEKINAIKLASVVAKVTRDRFMSRLNKIYPRYHFDIHKGYGTKRHKLAIKKHGLTKWHRLSFTGKNS